MKASSFPIASYMLALAVLTSFVASQFVSTKGLQFQLNGSPFSFAGANAWTIGSQDEQFIVDSFAAIKKAGYPVVRVAAWMERDVANGKQGGYGRDGVTWYQEWNNGVATLNTGANGLLMLDHAVQQAETAGVKFIMCLTNNWKDFGGMDLYVKNIKNSDDHDLFYTDPDVIKAYKKYVSEIVGRYKNSPAVFAWELANEARCQDPGCTSPPVTTWADQISTYIKSLDPNHLVSFGSEGYFDHGPGANHYDFNYDGASGQDYDALIKLPNIDFGTVHLYTNADGPAGPAYGLQLLTDHNAATVAANKPVIVEELGVNRSDPSLNMPDVMTQYQQYVLKSEAFQGSMTWGGLSVDAACPGGNDYAICEGDGFYGNLVTDFVGAMGKKNGGG